MIKNARQYRITKSQAEKFRSSIQSIKMRQPVNDKEAKLWQVHLSAMNSMLEELRNEMGEYDRLRAGDVKTLETHSFDEFPVALIKAIIASGMTQKNLANRLGLKEQQIQHYEATEYAGASLSRIREVIEILGLKISKQIRLPSRPMILAKLLSRLDEIGLTKSLALERILPSTLAARLKEDESETLILQAAATFSRILGISTELLFGSEPLQTGIEALAGARFKVRKGTKPEKISAYTFYAIYLSQILLDASKQASQLPIPANPLDLRRHIIKEYGEISFQSILRCVWDFGIPVLPLNDGTSFHGACFRFNGRNVIVLNQKTDSLSRWLFDLLHELAHAGEEPTSAEFLLTESLHEGGFDKNSDSEIAANEYAGAVLLAGRAEEIAMECVTLAKGNLRLLKGVVPRVARKNAVSQDDLANYLAFRISIDPKPYNWWGAARNLQQKKGVRG